MGPHGRASARPRRPASARRRAPFPSTPAALAPTGHDGRGGRGRSHARRLRASRRTGSESAPPTRLPPRPPSTPRRRRSSRTAVGPSRRARAERRSDRLPTRLGLAVSAVIRATISSARIRPDSSPAAPARSAVPGGEGRRRQPRPRGTVTRPSRGAATRRDRRRHGDERPFEEPARGADVETRQCTAAGGCKHRGGTSGEWVGRRDSRRQIALCNGTPARGGSR